MELFFFIFVVTVIVLLISAVRRGNEKQAQSSIKQGPNTYTASDYSMGNMDSGNAADLMHFTTTANAAAAMDAVNNIASDPVDTGSSSSSSCDFSSSFDSSSSSSSVDCSSNSY